MQLATIIDTATAALLLGVLGIVWNDIENTRMRTSAQAAGEDSNIQPNSLEGSNRKQTTASTITDTATSVNTTTSPNTTTSLNTTTPPNITSATTATHRDSVNTTTQTNSEAPPSLDSTTERFIASEELKNNKQQHQGSEIWFKPAVRLARRVGIRIAPQYEGLVGLLLGQVVLYGALWLIPRALGTTIRLSGRLCWWLGYQLWAVWRRRSVPRRATNIPRSEVKLPTLTVDLDVHVWLNALHIVGESGNMRLLCLASIDGQVQSKLDACLLTN